jgi:hypothetical protein
MNKGFVSLIALLVVVALIGFIFWKIYWPQFAPAASNVNPWGNPETVVEQRGAIDRARDARELIENRYNRNGVPQLE